MSDIVAFIVGIERYEEPGWSTASPCRNAVAMAHQALAIGARPENVLFFANVWDEDASADETRHLLEKLKGRGVAVNNALAETIDNGFRDLPVNRNANSRLLFFWSGHGYMTKERRRYLICEDYRMEGRIQNAFHVTHRFIQLRSVDYGVFGEHILLADVCAQHIELLRFSTADDPLGAPQDPLRRIEIFATPEGEYARAADGMGAFTTIALTALKKMPLTWPDPDTLGRAMLEGARAADVPPILITGWSPDGALKEIRIGRGKDDEIVQSVHAMLCTVPLANDEFRRHYVATIDKLGVPELGQAQGLLGMVRELAGLQDGITAGRISFGLLEFLIRVEKELAAAKPIRDWLARNGGQHINAARATIEGKLAAEQAKKILVLEVENDERGALSAFSSFLCLGDRTRLGHGATPPQRVRDWDDFCDKLRALLDTLFGASIELSEIHFAVEPPLFGLPFNLIERVKGAEDTLGEEYVVILRYRRPETFRDNWVKYADALRISATKKLKWIVIPADGSPLTGVTEKKGLYYACFVIARASSQPGETPEQRTIKRLLRLGIPYLCWLHGKPARPDWQRLFKRELGCWLKAQAHLSDLPIKVRERRIAQQFHARNANLLWDDPNFDPFSQLRGVRNG